MKQIWKKTKKPFPLTAGPHQRLDFGYVSIVKLRGSLLGPALTSKKLKAVPSSSWLIQQQEGTSPRRRDRACSRVGKQLLQGLEPPEGGKRLIFSGLQMLHSTDAWTDEPSVKPSTATYAIYLQTGLSHTK